MRMPDTGSLKGRRYLRLHNRGRRGSARADADSLRDVERLLDTFAPANDDFPPTMDEARRRLDDLDAPAYRRFRDYVRGPVSRLSPYVTHGFLSVPEIFRTVVNRGDSGPNDKFVQELAWREFFRHVWRHVGEGIGRDIRPAPEGVVYAQQLPEDLLTASTGVPVVDASVRSLYDTGYLHNHQRMWLASYVIHLRKVHWRVGADWMYGHLLDGDLPSNHLSWQWIAGTFSRRPYLFNADNVKRYAAHLDSSGTSVDRGYEELGDLAQSNLVVAAEPGERTPVVEPPALFALPPGVLARAGLPDLGTGDVAWVHPWSLGERPAATRVIGVIHAPFHSRFPWSQRRWAFVMAAMREICDDVWVGDLAELARAHADAAVLVRATLNPGYREALEVLAHAPLPEPRLTPDPDDLKPSFSRFWEFVLSSRAVNFHPE